MIKPQALIMPEVLDDDEDENAADTSFTSTDAQDGDVSIDSMGGHAISQQRDVFQGKDRKEIDFLITKVMRDLTQVILVIIELKRDDTTLKDAIGQVEEYFVRSLRRNHASLYKGHTLRALLVLGADSLRMEGRRHNQRGIFEMVFIDGYLPGRPHTRDNIQTVPTDCSIVNEWLLDCAKEWENTLAIPEQ